MSNVAEDPYLDDDEDLHTTMVRSAVLISGSASVVGSALLLLILGGFMYKLGQMAANCDVRVRSTLCHFIFQLAVCDLFTGVAYIMAYFIDLYDAQWFCISQAALMLIFEFGSLLWTASLTFLLWRISVLSIPEDKREESVWEKQMSNLLYTEVVCTIVSWGLPLVLGAILSAGDAYGRPVESYWCWLAGEYDHWWVELVCFYLPLWLVVCFCTFMLVLNYKNHRAYRDALLAIAASTPQSKIIEQRNGHLYEDQHAPLLRSTPSTEASDEEKSVSGDEYQDVTESESEETDVEEEPEANEEDIDVNSEAITPIFIPSDGSNLGQQAAYQSETAGALLTDPHALQIMDDYKRSRNLIVWYIGCFLLIWFWVSLGFILSTVAGWKAFPLAMLKYTSAPLQGFANFIVFGVVYLDFPFVLWRGWQRHLYTDIAHGAL